jgi:transcription initiation factor TFIID subunit 5
VIPLPPPGDKEAQAPAMEDLRACETAGAGCKPVGPDALPSAAFLTFVNAQHTLNGAALSSDATRAVGCFSDSSLRIYSLDSPETPPTVLRGHSGPVYAADWSPDDQLIVSAGADGTARLWSTKLSVGLVAFQGHMLPVWDVAFAPEQGYYFATAGADRTARLWCTERTTPLRVFAGHQSDVDVVRWHPNCHYVITGSSDRSARVWDLRTGGAVRMLTGHAAPVTALAAADDGVTLASADASGAVSVWDLGSARRVAGAPRAHAGPVWSLAYSRGGGAVLASGGADCAVRLWSKQAEGEVLGCDAAWVTKATPVVAASFTARNLLMCAGPLALSSRNA